MPTRRQFLRAAAASLCAPALAATPLIVSRRSGPWSSPATWSGGKVPAPGDSVQIAAGHRVVYDIATDKPLRAVYVSGILSFARDRDTRLDAALIRVGGGVKEDGAEHDMSAGASAAALEVGTQAQPIPVERKAEIRLAYFDGMDRDHLPSLICCGGRMDLHGAPMPKTWIKLAATAQPGDVSIALSDSPAGWRVGDRIIVTATIRPNRGDVFPASVRDLPRTEERAIASISGAVVKLDRPLAYKHSAETVYRCEAANLSRNVVVESAEPDGVRGHVMYHMHSSGAIGYVEMRNLGKRGVLGRYNLHFHQTRDTMRGASVTGASFWDSHNRFVTVHGSDYLVVKDCVGYRSIGHGYFLEDGSETYNIFDGNLAVEACRGSQLPNQILPFDRNEGAGFWWANSLNSFTGNTACECDEYGFRYQMAKTPGCDPVRPVRQPDGSYQMRDARTQPFLRFENNEAHCQRLYGVNLGGFDGDRANTVDGVGPDARHPFVIRGLKVWNAHWAFHSLAPSVLIDGMRLDESDYGFWNPSYARSAYRKVTIEQVGFPEVNMFYKNPGARPKESDYPKPLDPVDDLPPVTVVTQLTKSDAGGWTVRGMTAENGTVRRVVVNGKEARALRPNFFEWEIVLAKSDAPDGRVRAWAEDDAGNVELTPHEVRVGA